MEENKFGYLYVLECSHPAIYEIELTEEDQKLNSDEILEKYGLKEDTWGFMYTEHKVELETIKD